MSNQKHKLLGLGLFGLHVLGLVDQGKKESVETVLEKMGHNSLVTYINSKYPSRLINFETNYNVAELNNFFMEHSPSGEPDKCGVNENGLLTILAVIMDQTEYYIPQIL